MTTETQSTVFGSVLAELMEARGLDSTPEEIVALGERSGLDGDALLRDATDRIPGRYARQHLTGLADEPGLTGDEMIRLAVAYVFEEDPR